VVSLSRRCATVATIAVYRSARVGWHATTSRIRHEKIDPAESFPRQFRLALEALGPTFVKLGQLLSTRSDIIPRQLQQELSELRDHVASIPQARLMTELELSFGSKSSDVLEKLEIEPVACGSIAQVHRATLSDGRRVAVKVRRPGILADIEGDIWLLRILACLLARFSSRVRAYDPVSILEEFATLLRSETDFVREAGNIEAVGRIFADSGAVTIPNVMIDMSGESVLVMDWIEGVPLSDGERLKEVEADRTILARSILQAYGVMVFQSDRFHADPHPGNLIAVEGDRLGLVDFGEVGSVGPAERAALLAMVTAVLDRDGEALGAAVLSVSRTTRPVDEAEFGSQLAALLGPIALASEKTVRLGETLGRLLHLLRNHGIVLPTDLAVLIKTLIECESTTKELDPTMSMVNLVGEFGAFAPIPGAASAGTTRL
jgi:ubiquinone biosynthesis protein